jgi:hypothetical protein
MGTGGEHGLKGAGEQLADQVLTGQIGRDRDDVGRGPIAGGQGVSLDGLHQSGLADAGPPRHCLA